MCACENVPYTHRLCLSLCSQAPTADARALHPPFDQPTPHPAAIVAATTADAGAAMFVRPALLTGAGAAASKFTAAVRAGGRAAPTLVLDLDDTVLYR